MEDQVKYYVYQNEMLLYSTEHPSIWGVLSSLHTCINRPGDTIMAPLVDYMRPADLTDFDIFNVCPQGHLVPVKKGAAL
jgi:hypothetical protein